MNATMNADAPSVKRNGPDHCGLPHRKAPNIATKAEEKDKAVHEACVFSGSTGIGRHENHGNRGSAVLSTEAHDYFGKRLAGTQCMIRYSDLKKEEGQLQCSRGGSGDHPGQLPLSMTGTELIFFFSIQGDLPQKPLRSFSTEEERGHFMISLTSRVRIRWSWCFSNRFAELPHCGWRHRFW